MHLTPSFPASLLLSYSQPVLPPIVNSFLLLILAFIIFPCHYVFSLDLLFQPLLHCFHFSFIPFPSLRSSMSPITHWFLQTSFRSSSHLTILRYTHPSFRPFVNPTARTSKQTSTNSPIHPHNPTNLSINQHTHQFIHLPIHPCIHSSIRKTIHPSIH